MDQDLRDPAAWGLGVGKPRAVQVHFTTLECHRDPHLP